MLRFVLRLMIGLALASSGQAAAISPLLARGYAVLPPPQKVELGPEDVVLTNDWSVIRGGAVGADDVAIQVLREQMRERFALQLAEAGTERNKPRRAIELRIIPGAVQGRTAEAYSIQISSDRAVITANAGPGLLYGVTTLVQLVQLRDGRLLMPEVKITDWPDLELRHIYWDDAHHLERLDEFRRIVRRAALFKINGLALKLEGHFQYRSAPALVEPYALSPADLQELTSYALRYHVQLIPYLDAPGHVAFFLKHPEYAGPRISGQQLRNVRDESQGQGPAPRHVSGSA